MQIWAQSLSEEDQNIICRRRIRTLSVVFNYLLPDRLDRSLTSYLYLSVIWRDKEIKDDIIMHSASFKFLFQNPTRTEVTFKEAQKSVPSLAGRYDNPILHTVPPEPEFLNF